MGQGKKVLAIDIDNAQFALAVLARRLDKLQVNSLQFFNDFTQLKDVRLNDCLPVLIIPAKDIFIRSLKLPEKDTLRDKNKLLKWIEKQNIPFKIDSCYFDSFIMGNTLNFTAVRKELLDQKLKALSEAGIKPEGVISSFSSLFNLFIFNYPECKERFCIINVKNTYSEIIIYDAKRLWFYVLSFGSAKGQVSQGDFSSEVLRTFDSHNLQNPNFKANLKAIYLTGSADNALLEHLAKSTRYDVLPFAAYKRIVFLEGKSIDSSKTKGSQEPLIPNEQTDILFSALGFGLAHVCPRPNFIALNLIKDKIKNEADEARKGVLYKFASVFLYIALVLLAGLNLNSWIRVKNGAGRIASSERLLKQVLPRAKELRQGIDNLKELNNFLAKKIIQHEIWLELFAHIAKSRPFLVELTAIDGKKEGPAYSLNLSGKAKSYQDINELLSAIKKNSRVKDLKVVSTSDASPSADIEFKMRLDAQE